jgi:aldose 1-epimerase
MFPMVPYANRIAGNQFTFAGHVWRFAANNPPERLNVHGTGWQSPWAVENQEAATVTLVLDRVAPKEPYSFRATQRFVLTPEHLVVTTTVTNLSSWVMPFGFGQPPWFEREPASTVAFRAAQFWMEGPEGVATNPISITPELDFAVSRCLPGTYGGWDGRAEILFPSRGLGCGLRPSRFSVILSLC